MADNVLIELDDVTVDYPVTDVIQIDNREGNIEILAHGVDNPDVIIFGLEPGPKGAKGDTGDLTPELIAARDTAVAAAGQAVTAQEASETAETSAQQYSNDAAASASAAAADRTQTGLDRTAVANDKATVATAKDDAVAASTLAATKAQAASDDAVQTAADRVQTGADRAAVAADRTDVQDDKTVASQAADTAVAAQVATEDLRDQMLALYDSFDDRYLGRKTADPAVDNDGNPLEEGALYYNTTTKIMMMWDGGSWVAAYVSEASYAKLANNGSDYNVTTFRTNLDLYATGQVDALIVGAKARENHTGTQLAATISDFAAAADARVATAIGVSIQAHSVILDGTTASFTTTLKDKLDATAPLDSPALTGIPTAPTPAVATNTTQIATTAFVQAVVNGVINGAPGALDTLNELAAAMGDDPNFAATVTNTLAQKLDISAYTAADILSKLLTVDGAISGLDSQYLAGRSDTYYLSRVNHTDQQQVKTLSDAGILSGFRNKLINGNFQINQRGGASYTANGTYTVDRWAMYASSGTIGVYPRTFSADLPGYYGIDVITTGGNGGQLYQYIEDVSTLAGKRATLTFYVFDNAGNIDVRPTVVQFFGTGGSASVIASVVYKDTTTVVGMKKCTLVVDIPLINGKTIGAGNALMVYLLSNLSAVSLTVFHASLVEGDARDEDDPFSPRHIQQELALCQRYYSKQENVGFISYATGATQDREQRMFLPVTMRVTPTFSIFGGTGSNLAINPPGLNRGSPNSVGVSLRSTTTGAYYATGWTLTADAEF